MNMPWTNSIQILEVKMQKTFDLFSGVILEGDKKTHEKIMAQLNLLKKSEQIKYNRVNARLVELEKCFQGEIEHYRKTIELQERAAATDAEKGRL